jgi:hypothetical protein
VTPREEAQEWAREQIARHGRAPESVIADVNAALRSARVRAMQDKQAQ